MEKEKVFLLRFADGSFEQEDGAMVFYPDEASALDRARGMTPDIPEVFEAHLSKHAAPYEPVVEVIPRREPGDPWNKLG